jgi:hypothetical protein
MIFAPGELAVLKTMVIEKSNGDSFYCGQI